ncbi:MAG TPA: riboflavin synthase [Alphaproteobacteria bacterium]
MFTGIITDMGKVARVEPRDGAALYEIQTNFDLSAIAIGASIACSGVCLTVIEKTANSFCVQVSNETLDRTALGQWEEGTPVNLEQSLKLGDELGGHIVLGHVDGLAKLEKIMADGESKRMVFAAPEDLAPLIAQKGSVAIDGISLTVNVVDGARFSINVIPHTLKVTTLGQAKAGQQVHIEVDPLARYVARQMEYAGASKSQAA